VCVDCKRGFFLGQPGLFWAQLNMRVKAAQTKRGGIRKEGVSPCKMLENKVSLNHSFFQLFIYGFS
jgi:hypothetical protein